MEDNIITLPYYIIWYIDDEGNKHIAIIEKRDEDYVNYLKDRFIVVDCKLITK